MTGGILASLMALMYVYADVCRKRAFTGRPLAAVVLWTRIPIAFFCAFGLVLRHTMGGHFQLRSMPNVPLSPGPAAAVYLAVDIFFASAGLWCYFRALQTSPLSATAPFLAFIPTIGVLSAPIPLTTKLAGVGLIVGGSLVMGWEAGGRYAFGAALLLAIAGAADQKLIQATDIYLHAFGLAFGLCWSFFLIAALQRQDLGAALKGNGKAIVMAAVAEGAAMTLLLASYDYLTVSTANAARSSVIVLSVFAGAMFFREEGFARRAIAAALMLAGALVLGVHFCCNAI